MDLMVRAIRDNPEVFAAFVALIAVFGGLAGSYIGAKIQAAGGRAQANAATEAARITVEHQHLAAFHTDRRMVIVNYLHRAQAARTSALNTFRVEEPGLEEAFEALNVALIEVQLIAPPSVVDAAERLESSLEVLWTLTWHRAPASRARRALIPSHLNESDPVPFGTALIALNDMIAEYAHPPDLDEREEERQSRLSRGRAALVQAGATQDQADVIISDAELEDMTSMVTRTDNKVTARRRALIEAAREMFGSDHEGLRQP
ncbi:hypothetical protein [Streptomyces sp. NPDC001661]